MRQKFDVGQGAPSPYGTSFSKNGVNFAIFSKKAKYCTLALFSYPEKVLLGEIHLDPIVNKTGDVWHISLKNLNFPLCFAWRMGSHKKGRSEHFLLDPFAKALSTCLNFGTCTDKYSPLGLLTHEADFDWEGDHPLNTPSHQLIIYEMHVRGFTKHESSGITSPGTFKGLIEKLPHLLDLGVNAIELLPVFEFNECEWGNRDPLTGKRLYNYWGYSTVSFFSPMQRYASPNSSPCKELKELVKACHKNGIEVILDVVFNHTAEQDERGPSLSFREIDDQVYYLFDNQGHLANYTGCGNTVNCNHPVVRDFIRSCLKYWVTEYHIDGFRFDLAAIFMRGQEGEVLDAPPLIAELSEDPILANTKLIAEPWDALGLYKLGDFYPGKGRFSEWNDKYRDSVRRFIKGDLGTKEEFARRLSGSHDIFHRESSPTSSINFITAHDGFTLRDLVSYNDKHNLNNGQNNEDGHNHNLSWNSGFEGKTGNREINRLRERQMRNFHLALMLSQGIPMILMGDEYGHSKNGNNNSWCQDNQINWFLWNELEKEKSFYRFFKGLISIRKKYPILHLDRFLTEKDVDWHGTKPFTPDWQGDTQTLAFTLKQQDCLLYACFNTKQTQSEFELPSLQEGKKWRLLVDTSAESPKDFFEPEEAPEINGPFLTVPPHSSFLLLS